MATKKTRTSKKTATKKTAKPRTIKVVGGDDSDGSSSPTKATVAKTNKKSKAAPKEKRLSAIDAAAKVLAAATEPMNAKQLIDAIVTQGLWTSPAGKTPHATLYSAILREIKAKGTSARFTKTERGKFAANG